MGRSRRSVEVFSLYFSLYRKGLQHPQQRHFRPLPTVQYRLDHFRCEQRQAHHAGHVGGCNALTFGQFGDGGELARLRIRFQRNARARALMSMSSGFALASGLNGSSILAIQSANAETGVGNNVGNKCGNMDRELKT